MRTVFTRLEILPSEKVRITSYWVVSPKMVQDVPTDPLLCGTDSSLNLVIRFSGWKLNTYDIEEPLLLFSGVSEATVLGVKDDECGERVAVILRITCTEQESPSTSTTTLNSLRNRLATEAHLPTYKLPTLLKLLRNQDHLPKTSTGKVSKVLARKKYFPADYASSGKVEVWDLHAKDELPQRAWDWAGIRR